jgi:hypothetical protein
MIRSRWSRNISQKQALPISHRILIDPKLYSKVLELEKGKVAVEVGAETDLVPPLELIKTAVLNGVLDTQIDAAANKLRDCFAE